MTICMSIYAALHFRNSNFFEVNSRCAKINTEYVCNSNFTLRKVVHFYINYSNYPSSFPVIRRLAGNSYRRSEVLKDRFLDITKHSRGSSRWFLTCRAPRRNLRSINPAPREDIESSRCSARGSVQQENYIA